MITNLAFLMTDRCNAACDMCCFSCTPQGKQRLDVEMVKNYIEQAHKIGTIKNISFSGGEAILYPDDLCECMAFAKERGMTSTLVSNGFWGANMEKGRELIGRLAQAGLNGLSFSVDIFHQKYVPIETVQKAVTIAEEYGVFSAVTLMDIKVAASVEQSIENLRPLIYRKTLIVYPVFPAGKAVETIPEDQFICSCIPEQTACSFDNSITVLFDGSIMMCCSQFSRSIPMTHLGKFGETSLDEAVHKLRNDPYIYVLFCHGFKFYIDLARKLGFPVQERYTVCCHLCHDLLGNQDFVKEAEPFVKAETDRLRIARLLRRKG